MHVARISTQTDTHETKFVPICLKYIKQSEILKPEKLFNRCPKVNTTLPMPYDIDSEASWLQDVRYCI